MSSPAIGVSPKKSLVARATEKENGDQEHSVSGKGGRSDHCDDDNNDSEHKEGEMVEGDTKGNIFDETIVEGKRKRFTPVAEGQLSSWLLKHFVAKDGLFMKLGDVYDAYIEHCVGTNSSAVESWYLFKVVNETFPKGFAVDEESPYVETIRQKKKSSERKKGGSDQNSIKWPELIRHAIEDLGNPRKGLRYRQIRNNIAATHPAFQVFDVNSERLKKAVLREAYYGHIECVRGVGLCGFYRLPRTAEKEEEELRQEKQEQKEREAEKKKKTAAAGADCDTAEGDDDKAAPGEEQRNSEGGGDNAEGTKASKKKQKKSKHKKVKKHVVIHGEPQRMEDTFPLAMTYNSEPKEASVAKIRKYLADHYNNLLDPEKLRVCLEKGEIAGYWMRVAGSSSLNGTFQLTIEAFDPSADDDLSGKIMNAIVACTEPKTSSAVLLKKYVMDYHENFKVDKRPDLFRKALERAEANNLIVRLSGIGASGSFRLVKPFTPSPMVLQGEDTEHDYTDELLDNGDARRGDNLTVDSFRDAYKPRPSKRHARPNATHIDMLDPSIPNPRANPKAVSSGGKKRPSKSRASAVESKKSKVSYKDSSDDDEISSDEEVLPKKSANRHALKTDSKKKGAIRASPVKNRKSNVSYKESSDEDNSGNEEVLPKKSADRGVVSRGSKKKGAARASPGRNKKNNVSYKESSEEEDNSSDEEILPKKYAKKNAVDPKKAATVGSPGKNKKSNVSFAEDSSDEVEDSSDGEFEDSSGVLSKSNIRSPSVGKKVSSAGRTRAVKSKKKASSAKSPELLSSKQKQQMQLLNSSVQSTPTKTGSGRVAKGSTSASAAVKKMTEKGKKKKRR